jgi:hypothetical protein
VAKAIFNRGRVIPVYLRWVLTISLFISIYCCLSFLSETTAITLSITLSFLFPIIWSSYFILEINQDAQTITQAIWIVGLKTNKIKISSVDFLIKIERKDTIYVAVLMIKNGPDIILTSHEKEKNLRKKLNAFLGKLDITDPNLFIK